ncbi:MAG: PhoH family protein [Parachlamydiales bacterium]|nr:PhoH family protein [Parachlamydiales bacterium]
MGRKTFIIDTNVLLYDPKALLRFRDNDVVIPFPVIEEIDRMKKSSDEKGMSAREILRFFHHLKGNPKENFETGIVLPEGPTIRMPLIKENAKTFTLPLNSSRNVILYYAHYLSQLGEKVVLVSKEIVTRIMAEILGITAEDYESLKVSYESVIRGIKKITVSKEDMGLFYKDGTLSQKTTFIVNEFYQLVPSEGPSVLCTFKEKENRLEPIRQIDKPIWGLSPLNEEQRCVIDLLLREDVQLVALIGPAGTGKTLLTLACGLHQTFDRGEYRRILVSRPIVPLGKDIGYLPGTKEEKLIHWMRPIYDNLEILCSSTSGKDNTQETMGWILESNKFEMEAVTYIRGRSLPKMYMIIDEAQNLTPHEVKTIISRAGIGTKVVLTGDPTQIDNPYLDKDSNGLSYVVNRFLGKSIFGYVYLEKTERSKLAALAAEIM